jgi:DNA-directed RNA polymerase specialized sigma24 family protein
MATEPTSEPRPRRPGRLAARRAGNSEADRSAARSDPGSIPWPEASLSTSGAQRADARIDVTIRLPERPIADASEQLVNRELVAAALGRLTQEHRDVLRECYFRGSSVAKAARALEITPDMVKSRAYYALRALRLAIEELGGVQ